MKLKALILMLCCLLPTLLCAQQEKKVKDIFDTYGKQDGVVMVQLASDILQPKTRISYYRSLVANKTNDKLKADVLLLLANKALAKHMVSEVKKNGEVVNAVCAIPLDGNKNDYEYILFDNRAKTTFVYMRGNFHPDKLNDELKKLKELFLYINN